MATATRANEEVAQYIEIKTSHQDRLLLFRTGDYYALLFDDAIAASLALGLGLTKSGKHRGDDIPMCGLTIAEANECAQKLVALGFGLAFCEEVEDLSHARGRGAKVARRDVTRIVTPIERREDAPRRVIGRATRL